MTVSTVDTDTIVSTPPRKSSTPTSRKSPTGSRIQSSSPQQLNENKYWEYCARADFTSATDTTAALQTMFSLLELLFELSPDTIIRTDKDIFFKSTADMLRAECPFTVHQKTTGFNVSSTRYIICFAIRSTLQLHEIKHLTQVLLFLDKNKVFLNAHDWSLSDWDVMSVGWFMFKHPSRESVDDFVSDLTKRCENSTIKWTDGCKLVIYPGTQSSIQSTAQAGEKTKAFELHVQRRYRAETERAMTLLFGQDKSFVFNSLKYSNPKTFDNAIRLQNGFLQDFKYIKLTGLTEDMLFYFGDYIRQLPGVLSISPGIGKNPEGRFFVNVTAKKLLSVGKKIAQDFNTWLNLISSDALSKVPSTYLPPKHHFIVPDPESKGPTPSRKFLKNYNNEATDVYDEWIKSGVKSVQKSLPKRFKNSKDTWASVVAAHTPGSGAPASSSPPVLPTTTPGVSQSGSSQTTHYTVPTASGHSPSDQGPRHPMPSASKVPPHIVTGPFNMSDISSLTTGMEALKDEISCLRKLLLKLHPELTEEDLNSLQHTGQATPQAEHSEKPVPSSIATATTSSSISTNPIDIKRTNSSDESNLEDTRSTKRKDSKKTPPKPIVTVDMEDVDPQSSSTSDSPTRPRNLQLSLDPFTDPEMDRIIASIEEPVFSPPRPNSVIIRSDVSTAQVQDDASPPNDFVSSSCAPSLPSPQPELQSDLHSDPELDHIMTTLDDSAFHSTANENHPKARMKTKPPRNSSKLAQIFSSLHNTTTTSTKVPSSEGQNQH